MRPGILPGVWDRKGPDGSRGYADGAGTGARILLRTLPARVPGKAGGV